MMADVRLRIVGECIIEVGKRQICPDSPSLFAMLLYLALEGRAVPRTELCELFFAECDDSVDDSHRLRQLLYRLRQLGVAVRNEGSAVALPSVEALSASLIGLGREARSVRSPHSLEILPGYFPQLSRAFADWVDSARASANGLVRALLLDDLRSLRRECRWDDVVRTGTLLRQLDFANEEVVIAVTEGMFMLGQPREALDELDTFLREHTLHDKSAGTLRKLRRRIEKGRPQPGQSRATFHGRQETLLALGRVWSAAGQNRPTMCVLLGAPGMGKTRVVEEFGSRLAFNGEHTLRYACDASDRERPLSAFTQLVPQLKTMRGSLGASPELQGHLDLLAIARDRTTPLQPALLEATRAEIPLALVDLIEAVTSEHPLLLTIDDAHHLDAASWAVLCSLCDTRGSAALMVLCCCRGTDAANLPLTSATALVVHCLTPLSETDSRALLRELRSSDPPDAHYTRWCLEQAAGNPFYLCSLARSERAYSQVAAVPFDIHNLASSSYYALDEDARALLEACLYLGRFATVRRLQEIADIAGARLLTALRRLEGGGLITFRAGELRLSHALLEDAIRTLVPCTVAAALQARVAKRLEEEYERESYSVPLAWAAAESWLAAGDNGAAVRLLRHCAAQAAAVGEPQAAARTLRKIAQSALSLTQRASLQDEIISYAEVGGEPLLLQETLRERIEVARAMGESERVLEELEFRHLEVELQEGASPLPRTNPLMAILTNRDACATLRIRAGIRLLVAADCLLDESLARSTYNHLGEVLPRISEASALRRRAELIYETLFGDQVRALAIVRELLSDYPQPSLVDDSLTARHDASYSLSRLSHFELLRPVALTNYRFMLAHHVTSEALFALVLLVDSAVCTGDLPEAASWLQEAERSLSIARVPTQRKVGLYPAQATLALSAGKLDEAEAIVSDAWNHYPIVRAPRYAAVASAIKLRIKMARGDDIAVSALVPDLQHAYERGGHLGNQDLIVEALWCATYGAGKQAVASKLLTDYLTSRRRELTPPEVSLRLATAADEAWDRYSVPLFNL
jgi:DNA-binding SARP family transcriptional activator